MNPRRIPPGLIAFRALTGPAELLLAATLGLRAVPACIALLSAGVISDILDGVIARRIGSVTPALRRWDGRADLLFWACGVATALLLRPELRPSAIPMIVTLALAEAVAPAVSLVRFGEDASTHHLLSKLFALALWLLVTVWLAAGRAPVLQWTVFILGLASQAEAVAIMLVLPAWRADVPSLWFALRLRLAQQFS